MRSKHAWIASVAFGTFVAGTPSRAHAEDSRATPRDEAGSPIAEDAPSDAASSEWPPSGTGTSVALTGGAMFVGFYGAAFASSYLFDAPGLTDLRYPVVGPWLSLRDAGSCSGGRDCSTGTVVARVILSIVDGIGQVGGLGVLAEGLFIKSAPSGSGALRTNTALKRRRERSFEEGVHAAPFVAGRDGGAGLLVWGEF